MCKLLHPGIRVLFFARVFVITFILIRNERPINAVNAKIQAKKEGGEDGEDMLRIRTPASLT